MNRIILIGIKSL